MTEAISELEEAIGNYRNILEMLMFLATASASIVAVWSAHIARTVNRLQLSGLMHLVYSTGTESNLLYSKPSESLVLRFINEGYREVKLDYFSIHFSSRIWMRRIFIINYSMNDYGDVIEAGSSTQILLSDVSAYREAFKRASLFKIPILDRIFTEMYIYDKIGNRYQINYSIDAAKFLGMQE